MGTLVVLTLTAGYWLHPLFVAGRWSWWLLVMATLTDIVLLYYKIKPIYLSFKAITKSIPGVIISCSMVSNSCHIFLL